MRKEWNKNGSTERFKIGDRKMVEKRNILIIMGRYLPGYKDGGPVRSIKNLTDYLGDEYNFKILTCDRDHGDIEPYPNIKVNDWNRVGKADVYYVPPKGFTFNVILKLVRQVDLVYVCGCFNDYAINTLVLNYIGKIRKPVIIAAMGLFSPLEFKHKFLKKKLFISFFNVAGLFKNVYWSSTSDMEIEEIQKQVKAQRDKFFIAEDLPRIVDATSIHKEKEKNNLKIIWISRVTYKKNLLGAIEILKSVNSHIIFDIYGSIHDDVYWKKCQEELNKLPSNIVWNYLGELDSNEVVQTLRNYHVFLFPTFGENYGHVIQEALSAGCPCVISDQTPWRNLEKYNAGCVYCLEDRNNFVKSIEYFASMHAEEFNEFVIDTLNYAIENSNDKFRNTGYRKIFDTLCV